MLAMPLASRWADDLVLLSLGSAAASHDVTDTVYRSTREGFLMLAPVQTDEGTVADFQIISANPGAASLLGRSECDVVWSFISRLPHASDHGGLLRSLVAVFEAGTASSFEWQYRLDETDRYLRASAAVLDTLVILTLTDVTELKSREAGFRLMFESNPVPMALVDTATMRFMDVNRASAQHYGYSRERFVGASHTLILHPAEHEQLRAVEADPSRSYEGERIWRHVRADGAEIAVRPYARRLTLGRHPAALVAFFDVTESRNAEQELRRTKAFLDTVIENIPSALLVEDAEDHRLLLINKAGEAMLGLQRQDALGQPSPDYFALSPAAKGAPAGSMPSQSMAPDAALERTFQTPRGTSSLLSVKKLAIQDQDGSDAFLLTIAEDVTERRAFETRIAHMAHHDALTDLPNRTLFTEQVKAALARASRQKSAVAVLGIDLDAFKAVNDTLGHSAGDALLQDVAARLAGSIRPGDMAARLGGDEFAILLDGSASMEGASALAGRIVQDLARPFTLAGHDVQIGASVGVALGPHDGADCEALLRNADLALYRAKEEGKGTFRFFEPDMNARLQARRDLERDLRKALEHGEFELHFQPLIELETNRVCGCEALLRWRHPVRGSVSPGEFIPVAEDTGLIGPIGEWVLREACAEARRWPSTMTVAVNVSAVQFRDPHLVTVVVSALAASGLPPERLEIEITESVLLANTDAHVAVLHRLRQLGVKIAMDDFGTGYSSLSYLSTFPFDKIKIDQSFVRDVKTNRQCEAIVNAIADLGAHLGIVTVAEGVETEAQMAHLQSRGCRQAQGYLFSRPLPASSLRDLIGPKHRSSAAA